MTKPKDLKTLSKEIEKLKKELIELKKELERRENLNAALVAVIRKIGTKE